MDDKIKNLIEKSGMITHNKVVEFLKQKGWEVMVSSYYYDSISGKTKEIDIVAEKPFYLYDDADFSLNIQLFVECKYIDKGIAFWFDNKNMKKAIFRVLLDTTYLEDSEVKSKKFHYLNNEDVAKVFTPNENKEDIIYKALSQCLNSMIYYKQNDLKTITDQQTRYIEHTMRFPIILCNNFDNFFRADFEKKEGLNINKNFQLEVNYVYSDANKEQVEAEYFLIDVINFSNNQFDSFLQELEKNDIEIVRKKLIEERKEKTYK